MRLRRDPTPAEVLRAVAASRGWVVGHGLPDEARAGRAILKDYCDGRLLACEWPPGHPGAERQRARLAAERGRRGIQPDSAAADAAARAGSAQQSETGLRREPAVEPSSSGSDNESDTPEDVTFADASQRGSEGQQVGGAANGADTAVHEDTRRPDNGDALQLSMADLDLMDEMNISTGAAWTLQGRGTQRSGLVAGIRQSFNRQLRLLLCAAVLARRGSPCSIAALFKARWTVLDIDMHVCAMCAAV